MLLCRESARIDYQRCRADVPSSSNTGLRSTTMVAALTWPPTVCGFGAYGITSCDAD